jgi:hypothetical protein
MKNTLQRRAFGTRIGFLYPPDVGSRESLKDPNETRAADPKPIGPHLEGWARTKQVNRGLKDPHIDEFAAQTAFQLMDVASVRDRVSSPHKKNHSPRSSYFQKWSGGS